MTDRSHVAPHHQPPAALATDEPVTDLELPHLRIALVAHDNCKADLLQWAEHNRDTLRNHVLFATGTTGTMLEYELGFPVHRFKSGPLGGDLQIGARIAEGGIDMMVFLWDPLEPQPHDPDVKALLRVATLANVPTACNRATADYLITSPLLADLEHSPHVGTTDPDAGSVA